ncbi:MAG: discoidin domain-containing protein, partial [Chitinivibrionales bacterium]
NVGAFGYLPSQAGAYTSTSTAGEITTHSIAVSTDNSSWTTVVNNGTWAASNSPKVDTFARSTARYVRLTVGAVNSGTPTASEFGVGYRPVNATGVAPMMTQGKTPPFSEKMTYKIMGDKVVLPKEFAGKTVSVEVYNLFGQLVRKATIKNMVFDVAGKFGSLESVYLIKFKVLQ